MSARNPYKLPFPDHLMATWFRMSARNPYKLPFPVYNDSTRTREMGITPMVRS
jgi:hypothetical protein